MIYTIDNPKLVESIFNFEGKDTFTGVVKDDDGDVAYYLNGKRHREDDPAIIWGDGDKEWYLHGKRHRTDGSAREFSDGDKEWWLDGKRHREDGPAVEIANGNKSWYLNGKCYGENDDFTNESWIRFIKLELLK